MSAKKTKNKETSMKTPATSIRGPLQSMSKTDRKRLLAILPFALPHWVLLLRVAAPYLSDPSGSCLPTCRYEDQPKIWAVSLGQTFATDMAADVIGSFVLCVALGVCIVFQALLNARLGHVASLNSYSALMSFLVGIPPVVVYFLVESRFLHSGTISAAPWYLYLGGILGAVYIIVIIFTVQRIGAASVLSTVVASQVLASVVVDHFGILGTPTHAVSPGRIAGALLIVAGSVLVGLF